MCLWATLCKVVHAQMIIADDASTNDRKASATADVKRFISKGITPGTSPYSVSVLEEDWLVEHISGVGAVTLTGKRTSCGQHPLTRNRTWMILRRGEARHICFGPGDPITTEHEARNVAIETLHATDWLGSTTLLEWIKNLGPSVISMSGHSQGGVVAATLASDPLLGNLLPCCTSVVGTGQDCFSKLPGCACIPSSMILTTQPTLVYRSRAINTESPGCTISQCIDMFIYEMWALLRHARTG
jgi:hypothetical protein